MDPVPEQDVRFGDPDAPPTTWTEVRRLLETAELFWISTVRSDGRPHVTPLPAVWDADRLHFCTGPTEQKAVNLARNPQVALTTGGNRRRRSGRRVRGGPGQGARVRQGPVRPDPVPLLSCGVS